MWALIRGALVVTPIKRRHTKENHSKASYCGLRWMIQKVTTFSPVFRSGAIRVTEFFRVLAKSGSNHEAFLMRRHEYLWARIHDQVENLFIIIRFHKNILFEVFMLKDASFSKFRGYTAKFFHWKLYVITVGLITVFNCCIDKTIVEGLFLSKLCSRRLGNRR